jgi:hypothetical protein
MAELAAALRRDSTARTSRALSGMVRACARLVAGVSLKAV